MGKLSKAFLAASIFTITACVAPSVANDKPGHDPRPLTSGEIAMAKTIFGNQMDYSAVRVSSHRSKKSKAFHGQMYLTWTSYADDFSKVNSKWKQSNFLHELAHLWQEQQGVNLITSAIKEFFRHGGNYSRAYRYNLTKDVQFGTLGIEQQGEIIEDYWSVRQRVNPTNAALKCKEIFRFEAVLRTTFPHIQSPELCTPKVAENKHLPTAPQPRIG